MKRKNLMKAGKGKPVQHNVSNLHRGLDIMELLLQHPEGLGISDVYSTQSWRTGLHPAGSTPVGVI